MLDQIVALDTELFLYLNTLGSPTWDTFWLIVTNKLTFIPLYAGLLFLIYKKNNAKYVLRLLLVVILMITFTDQVTNLFKNVLVMRPRPCHFLDNGMRFIAERCGRHGFFSGHSSNSMAVAIFIGLVLKPHYKNLIFIMICWSIFVAYSRIYVGVHYPLDIICGMLFGVLSGTIFYKLNTYAQQKYAS